MAMQMMNEIAETWFVVGKITEKSGSNSEMLIKKGRGSEFRISDFGFRIYLRWAPLRFGSDFGFWVEGEVEVKVKVEVETLDIRH